MSSPAWVHRSTPMNVDTQFTPLQPDAAADASPQAAALQNLLDQSPATMFSVDREFCYTAFNRKHFLGMQALYGVEIHLFDNFIECIQLPADRETARSRMVRALGGEELVEQVNLGSEDGFRLTGLLMHTPIRGGSGEITGVNVYSEDVTEMRSVADRLLENQAYMEGLVQEHTAQLQASETRHRRLFDNMNSLILVIDPQTGMILDANPAACTFYRVSHALLTRLSLSNLSITPPELLSDTLQKFASGELEHFNAVHRLPNGETREVEIYGGPLDFNGRPAVMGVLHDVTGRKLAEQARRAGEEKFRALFHTLPLPSVIYRLVIAPSGEVLDGIIEDVNDFGAAFYGQSPQDLLGHRASEFIQPHVLGPYLKVCREIKESGKSRMFETFFETTGQHFLATAMMLSHDLYALINLDISEQKQAEGQLRSNEERYRQLFETSLDAVLVTDQDGRVQAANPAATDIFGWTSAEFLHLSRKDLFDQTNPALQAAREVGRQQGRFMGELILIRKDGSRFPAAVSSSAFTDWRGKRSIGIFIYDLSVRRDLEAALRESEARQTILFQNSREAMLIAIPESGAIESANPAALRLFGCSEAELRALGRRGIVDMSDPQVESAVDELSEGGRFSGRVTMIRKDASKFPAQVSTFFFVDRAGRTRSCVLIHELPDLNHLALP